MCESKTARLSPDLAVLTPSGESVKSSARVATATLLLLTGAAWMVPYGDFTRNGATREFQAAALLMAAGWLCALTLRGICGRTFWTIAIALRLIFLPMAPGADVHRYIWEGRIQTHGFDPYRDAPNAEALRGLRDQNWAEVQFKDTTAIYPPLTELGFRLLAFMSQTALFFKLAFVVVDLAVCFLLSRRFGFAQSLLYAWNPLVLYSFAGGAHFDSWFLFCLVGGWLLWEKKAFGTATLLFGAATAVKWMGLPIFVWSIVRISKTEGMRRATVAACVPLLAFVIPWLAITSGDLSVSLFPKDFVLYARSFGLIATTLSSPWPDAFGGNGPFLLPVGAAAFILMRSPSVTLLCERWLALLLVLSPMVHAWYFTWLIPFAVATRNAGSIAVSISAFAYFGILHLSGVPRGGWPLLLLQYAIIWLPLICGFAWSEYQRARESVESFRLRNTKPNCASHQV